VGDAWDPGQYERFKNERSAPFYDLLALVEPAPGGRVVDLGCGTGELTIALHHHTGAAETVGIDNSAEMLKRAGEQHTDGVSFQDGDIDAFDEAGAYDLVLANAALQWVPDHPLVLTRWSHSLKPGGQLAVQVPANVDHPGHVLAAEVAASPEFAGYFDGPPPPDTVLNVLKPEAYATLLHELGFTEQHVRLQVYPHLLPSTADVVEWTKGTSLTRFRRILDDETYERFIDRYRERVVQELGDRRPYFYAFKRILFRGRLNA
jgi:trans-aconitate 2-methyltransferase